MQKVQQIITYSKQKALSGSVNKLTVLTKDLLTVAINTTSPASSLAMM